MCIKEGSDVEEINVIRIHAIRTKEAEQKVNVKDKQKYIERYTQNYEKYGYDPRALGWRKGRQEIRFQILASISDLRKRSVLDLGCGFGNFYDFLVRNGWEGTYTGFDIVPILVKVARERHPDLDIRLLDVLEDGPDEKFDFVLAAGVFNARLRAESNEVYIERMLAKMHEMSEIGIAADFVSSYVDYRVEGTYHADPEIIFRICKKLSKRVVLRHDYLPYEFAVYLYKDDSVDTKKNVFRKFLSGDEWGIIERK